MKVLITVKFKEEQFQKIRNLGYELIYKPEAIVENCEEVNSADILVAYNPFGTLDIKQITNLKYIQTTSVGIDQVPKNIVEEKNIIVANNKGGYSIPMGEWIVMYILEIYKNSMKLYMQQQKREWKMDMSVSEVYGKRIGFVGTGTIASEAAKRIKGFGVEIWGVNTDGKDKKYFDKCFATKYMDEVFENCDVVAITIPSTEDTIGMINDDKFKLMKNGSVFINVGRGNIINEEDLINNIEKFRGVALDVVESEPLDKDSKLWEFENVIITPHNSWISEKNNERRFNTIYNNLKNYIENKPLNNIVDIKKGY